MNNGTYKDSLTVNFSTRVIIDDPDSGDIYLDKSNAIHSQNMARAIARGLSNEDNSIIYRIAFGNGGSFTDAGENIILNSPNDGTQGEGWESRLYNETYSEILDGPSVGTDPGSIGPANIRLGGGSVPEEDSPANSVTSVEVGRRSNIIATVTLNRNEPTTQLPATSGFNTISDPEETTFQFDELGFYTPGKGASASPAFLRIDVGSGDTNSDSILDPNLPRNTPLDFNLSLDGNQKFTTIQIPANGSGSGPAGEITFGDLCEGFNDTTASTWISGDTINEDIEMLITNRSTENTYATILGAETFGDLVLRSKSAGSNKEISATIGSGSFLEEISVSNGSNIEEISGDSVGVINDPSNTENERERLLTHLTFPPILKKANRQIRIRYILTVSVAQVGDTMIDIQDPVQI